MHTVNATSTVERIVNFFPPQQHHFVFNQLSFLLKGVVSLRLLPRLDVQGLIPAYEVMTLSPTISSLIRENKLWETPKYINSGEIYGMKGFNQCLLELVEAGKLLRRPFLHSRRLEFHHPQSDELLAFHSPLASELDTFLSTIRLLKEQQTKAGPA